MATLSLSWLKFSPVRLRSASTIEVNLSIIEGNPKAEGSSEYLTISLDSTSSNQSYVVNNGDYRILVLTKKEAELIANYLTRE